SVACLVQKKIYGGRDRELPRLATSLTTRNHFTPNFRGWRLDENLKPKSPPYRGATHKKLGDKGKMAVLAFNRTRLRCDDLIDERCELHGVWPSGLSRRPDWISALSGSFQ